MLVKTETGSENRNNIIIDNEGKTLFISFEGTLDLYFLIDAHINKFVNPITFRITKENYKLYEAFDSLYIDIKEREIFRDETIPFYVDTVSKLKEYLKREDKIKEEYIKYNISNYNDLFDEENKTITWYSDETNEKVANYVKIIQADDEYRLEFYTQKELEGYDREFNLPGRIAIRFRNSGSRYDPFNVVFMRLYNNLQNITDTNEKNHQIHIEEYLYNRKKVLRKNYYK